MDCYKRLKANPFGYQKRKGEFRQVLHNKLKYRVVYRIHEQTVHVVQVRLTSRKPSKKSGP